MNEFVHHKRLVLLSAAKAEWEYADLVDLIDAISRIDKALKIQALRKIEDTWAALCEDDCRAGLRYLKPLLPKPSTRKPRSRNRYAGVCARAGGKFLGEVTLGGQKLRTKTFTVRGACADALQALIDAYEQNWEVEPLPSYRSASGYKGVREKDTGQYIGRRVIKGKMVTTSAFETAAEASQALAELVSTALERNALQ